MDTVKTKYTLLWIFRAHEIKVSKINVQVNHRFGSLKPLSNNGDCPFFIIET